MTAKQTTVIIAKPDEYEALKEYASLMARLDIRVCVWPESLSNSAAEWCRKCGLAPQVR